MVKFVQRGTNGKKTTLEQAQPEFYNRISKAIEKLRVLIILTSRMSKNLDIQTKSSKHS